jgi:hypothetical protein
VPLEPCQGILACSDVNVQYPSSGKDFTISGNCAGGAKVDGEHDWHSVNILYGLAPTGRRARIGLVHCARWRLKGAGRGASWSVSRLALNSVSIAAA